PTPTTTVVSAPSLSATAKGKQPARATTLTEPTYVQRTEAEQLKIILKRSRQETHISQQRGSGTDEGTGSRPGVPDVPSDDSEEELSWNSSDDEDTGGLKGEEKAVSMHQLALHLKKQPRVQADLPHGLNLDNCLPVSLLLQRNLCRLPVRWRNLHIRC
nr:hypothetical protein [Tanacetum cinerariifolium]